MVEHEPVGKEAIPRESCVVFGGTDGSALSVFAPSFRERISEWVITCRIRLIKWLAGNDVVLVNAEIHGRVNISVDGKNNINLVTINTAILAQEQAKRRQQVSNTLH